MATRGFHTPFVIQNLCNALREQISGLNEAIRDTTGTDS